MPVFEGAPVYTADNDDIEIALGLDNIDEKTAIPAGLMKASNNVAVPIKYNGDFLIGPEGAHMNISGISTFFTFAVRQAVREQALPFRHRMINGNYDKKTYQFAMKNTKYNNDGKTVVEKNDMWRDETEWDNMFEQMKKERGIE